MEKNKPSLDLLRTMTDEHLLRALMAERRLTRAELAGRTGLSKPTVSEGVRRLAAAGLLVDTGARTTGRGRVGTYYSLADDVGSALVVSLDPEGVVAEVVDAYGEVVVRAHRALSRPAPPRSVGRALREAARSATTSLGPAPRLAVISATDPVARATGRLTHLPQTPFLLGDVSPAAELRDLVAGPVLVDNDVNWAARAERSAAGQGMDDFVYFHLGVGLGGAVVDDGEVRRGHGGFVGEIATVLTVGARGRAVPFTEVFAELGLRHQGTTAIDVQALLERADAGTAASRELVRRLAVATAGVLASVVALCDPSTIVLGGPWGMNALVAQAVHDEFARGPRSTTVQAARVVDDPSLSGARAEAVERLRTAIVTSAATSRARTDQ